MFRCEICGELVGPRVAQKKKVVEKMAVVHHDKYYDADGVLHHKDTPGTQIIKELSVCRLCFEI